MKDASSELSNKGKLQGTRDEESRSEKEVCVKCFACVVPFNPQDHIVNSYYYYYFILQ